MFFTAHTEAVRYRLFEIYQRRKNINKYIHLKKKKKYIYIYIKKKTSKQQNNYMCVCVTVSKRLN